MKIFNALDESLANSCIEPLQQGGRKYVNGSRTVIFGHAGHQPFRTASAEYVDVPGTYSASSGGGNVVFRLEVTFAAWHDGRIGLRMCDPFNNSIDWEVVLQAGHASSDWWSSLVTDPMSIGYDPWQRQSCLQIRSLDGREVVLGSVVISVVSVD